MSSAACPTDVLITLRSNSGSAANSMRAVSRRRAMTSGLSVRRPSSLSTRTSHEGGARKTCRASSALELNLQQHIVTGSECSLDRLGGRAVAMTGELRPLKEGVIIDQLLKADRIDKVVVHPIDLTRPWRAGRR
jgi:hypothetical protein